jgi:hypothetical protein
VKPAIWQTYRKDGSAYVTPVWSRGHDGAFEVVIAKGDRKLAHLRRNPRSMFVAQLVECDVTPYRTVISGRDLGEQAGRRFAEQQRAKPGVLVRLVAEPQRWDLSGMLGGGSDRGAGRSSD